MTTEIRLQFCVKMFIIEIFCQQGLVGLWKDCRICRWGQTQHEGGAADKGKGSHNCTGADAADRQEGGRPGQAWLKVARPACTGSTFFVLVFRPLSFLANSYSFLVLSVLFCPFYSFLGWHPVLFGCISLFLSPFCTDWEYC